MWKLFHKVVPTDDSIIRLNIPLASRCRCCVRPCIETAEHLIFNGDWVTQVWGKLAEVFDRPRVTGLRGLIRIWLRGNSKDFMDCLACVLASCAVWELWKARNAIVFDSRPRNIWSLILQWAQKVSRLITASAKDSVHTRKVLAVLHLNFPGHQSDRMQWMAWCPPSSGYVLNIAFLFRDGMLKINGILREGAGCFVVAVTASIARSRPLAELESFLRIFHELTMLHGWVISAIQSSHPSFWLFSSDEDEIPADDLYHRRRILSMYPAARIRRVSPSQNQAPMALVCTLPLGTVWTFHSLPLVVRRIIRADALRLPSPASHFSIPPPFSQDDLHIPPGPGYRFVGFSDDMSR